MGNKNLERINRNISKLNKWSNEKDITESRKEALERMMVKMLQMKEYEERDRS